VVVVADEPLGWVILELMGHRRLAGYVTEQDVAGVAMLRIDVPCEPPTTQYYSGSAVYCITPTSEDTARAVAAMGRPAPVQRWELPAPPGWRDGPDLGDDPDGDVDGYDGG
jgi:hypothetical protein